jgi:hypothetical protein
MSLHSLLPIRLVASLLLAVPLLIATPASAQEQFNSNSGSGSGSANPQSCDEAYDETEHQIVAARIAVDANFKKQEIDCNGDSGCRQAASKEYQANMRDIAKQQVDASAQHDICRAQAMGGGGGGVPGAGAPGVPGGAPRNAPYSPPQNPAVGSAPNNAPLGSPQNPLRGYVSNAPPPKPAKPPAGPSVAPRAAPSAPQNPTRGLASTAPNSGNPPTNPNTQPHTPLGQLNQALNDAMAKIPGGSQGLQQAGQAAGQIDKTINNGLNDAARKLQAIRDSMAEDMINKWTHPMSPQQAFTEVATNWAGNAVGVGLGAGAGSLLKGAVSGGVTKSVASEAAKAAAKAAVKEGAVTAGAGSALKGAGGALASRGSPSGESGAPVESGQGGPGESGNQPQRLSSEIAQEATEFGNDFGADSAEKLGPGTGYGNQPAPPCFARNACFNTAIAQARIWQTEEPFLIQGARDIGKSDLKMSGKQIEEALRRQFGGAAAAENPVYTPAERLALQQGIPVPASPTRLRQILASGKIGSQWLVFIQPNQGIGHVFNARFINNGIQMWDATQRMNGQLWFSAPLKNVFVYQIH